MSEQTTESKYKATWKEFALNKEFWEEVLVGRTIKELTWDDNGISALVLDNGEIIHLPKENGRISINDGPSPVDNSVSNLDPGDHLLVFLNDELIGCVIEADAKEGYVVQRLYDNSQPMRVTRAGTVRIEFNGKQVVRVEMTIS